jgi:DNA-binding NarL/FixJ family response regulator
MASKSDPLPARPDAANSNRVPSSQGDTPRPALEASTRKRRVLIIDSEPIVCLGLSILLDREADLEACGTAHTAEEAFRLAAELEPSAIIVEVDLKGVNGIEITKRLRTVRPDCPILIISNTEENVFAQRALRAGASGFISKSESCEALLVAIRRVLSGKVYVSEAVTESLVSRMVGRTSDGVQLATDVLSDRELEVFGLIGSGFGTKEIAAKLGLSVKTIDTYREHLKVKLRIKSGVELVRFALQWINSETKA